MGDEDGEYICEITEVVRRILSGGDPKLIRSEVRDRFNIELDDNYVEEVNRMGEISEGFYNNGLYEGRIEGRIEGKEEGIREERARFVSILAVAVIKLMERSFTLEESLELVCVPEDCIDEVRAAVLERRKRVSR